MKMPSPYPDVVECGQIPPSSKPFRFAAVTVHVARAFAAVCILVSLAVAATAGSSFGSLKFISWGATSNSLKFNRALNIHDTVQGCSSAPEACMNSFRVLLKPGEIERVYASILFDPVNAPDYARRYGKLSRDAPWLVEVDIDDFVGQYERVARQKGQAAAVADLGAVVGNLKSANPRLQFGIILYEDELNSPDIREPLFPGGLRGQVDDVHFYIHYRKNGPAYANYLPKLKSLFPHARIIGGIYAYDRLDYLPCAQGGWLRCSAAEEAALFSQTVQVQAKLLRNGQLYALETIPGYLGREPDWAGWNDPTTCRSARRTECIRNTVELRRLMLNAIQATFTAN
jgi:hypothetical protein